MPYKRYEIINQNVLLHLMYVHQFVFTFEY
jgi:hypothetical protein